MIANKDAEIRRISAANKHRELQFAEEKKVLTDRLKEARTRLSSLEHGPDAAELVTQRDDAVRAYSELLEQNAGLRARSENVAEKATTSLIAEIDKARPDRVRALEAECARWRSEAQAARAEAAALAEAVGRPSPTRQAQPGTLEEHEIRLALVTAY